ncbi:hypothetical protein [Acidisphaera sp. S103]|uniref:hypothetical protein n=1 Tax=Acidisphaera sp. S103 TaxID=1747223 RepID=UPI00131A6B84|nr:hypothetical protein [Acidisphaera sp. S103]
MGVSPALIAVGYGLVCLAVGLCGRYRRGGFVLTTVLAVVLTPPIVLAALYLLGPKVPTPRVSTSQQSR